MENCHLSVCSREAEAKWNMPALSLSCRALLVVMLVGTVCLLLETHFGVQYVAGLSEGGYSVAPGPRIAAGVAVSTLMALAWVLLTVGGCYVMHESLMDPEVTFPQISELGCGPTLSKALYRIGFASAAALLGGLGLLHQELALPHLPGGRQGDLGADFTHWTMMAAAGVAMQGIFLLQPGLTLQTGLHAMGALVFFHGVWCHMGAAQRLYLPGSRPSYMGLIDQEAVSDDLSQAVDEAAASLLLQHGLVRALVWIRHSLLMRAPLAVFVVPVINQMSERANVPTHAVSPRTRSMMGLMQWLVVFDFVSIFISFGPELVVASFLPLPLQEA